MVKINNKYEEEEDNLPANNTKPKTLERTRVPQCTVCNSEYRDQIEIWVARGYKISEIHKQLDQAGAGVSYRSILRHKENHMDLEKIAYRTIIEKNMEELSQEEAKNTIRLVTGQAFIDLLLQRGFDELVNGTMPVEAKDVIKAIEVKSTMDEKGVMEFQTRIMAQIDAIRIAMEEALSADQARTIIERAKVIAESKLQGKEPPKQLEEVVVVLEEENYE
jgi:hypothetical protein